MSEARRGLLAGAAAYGLWGLFPLYWMLLDDAGALEILAVRVVASLVVMAGLTVALGRTRHFRRIVTDRRTHALLAVAGLVISVNWFTFIWGVTNGRVLETSLGYFVTPLVSVGLGVVVLRERLRRLQWAALGLAALAVLVLTLDYGRVPWVALALATSFGTYGLLKKQADVGAVESLAFETLVAAPAAIGVLAWLAVTGVAAFPDAGVGQALLLASTGLVTAVPLICFGAAATRIPLTTMGFLQYLAPTLHFVLGITVFAEALPLSRALGFALVWTALVMFTIEAWRHRKRQLRLAAVAATGG